MLEVVREVAAELLVELGEVRAARDRLGDHLEAWSTVAGAGLAGPDSRRWRARVDAEVDDLRAVLHWAVEDDRAERVVRIAAALTRYWWLRGMLVEMLEIAEQTARLPSAARLPDDATALLLWSRGTMRIALGRSDEAPPLLEQSLEPARRLDDDALLGHALTALAMTRAPSPEVRALLEEAVERLRRSGDRWSTAYALVPLGHVLLLLGDVGGAAERHAEALGLATAIDDDHLRAQAHDQLAGDLLMTGDTGAARAHLGQAVVLHRATRDQEGLSYCLDGMAALALATGDAPLAGRLLGAADRAREVVGASPWPFVRPLLAQLSDAADALLGPDVSAAERAAGARLSALAALQEGAVRLSLPVDA
jgi:tetratricopeptide (TPR) repeat protein